MAMNARMVANSSSSTHSSGRLALERLADAGLAERPAQEHRAVMGEPPRLSAPLPLTSAQILESDRGT